MSVYGSRVLNRNVKHISDEMSVLNLADSSLFNSSSFFSADIPSFCSCLEHCSLVVTVFSSCSIFSSSAIVRSVWHNTFLCSMSDNFFNSVRIVVFGEYSSLYAVALLK